MAGCGNKNIQETTTAETTPATGKPGQLCLQGFARGVSSLVVSDGRQVIILLPLAWVLGSIMGINGIWWSFFISETVVVVFAVWFVGRLVRRELAGLES